MSLFNGKPVLTSAKLVDWHVSYSNTEGFGYSDAVGCPYFSQAAVVAAVAPKISDIKDGFSLTQRFFSEGYPVAVQLFSYEQRFDFYNDGRFRVVAGSLGARLRNGRNLSPGDANCLCRQTIILPNGRAADWKNWTTEAWQLQKSGTELTRRKIISID